MRYKIQTKNPKKLKGGFTLLELLLVIAIVAVLAGIIIFSMNPEKRVNDVNDAKSHANNQDLQKAFNAFVVDNSGNLPSGFFNITTPGIYDICKNGTTGGCIKFDELVSNGYVQQIPLDERISNSVLTGYKVKYNPSNKSAFLMTQEDYLSEVGDTTSLTNGLIGYWKLDEEVANTCVGGVNDSCDLSGNGYDGAWNGTFLTILGKYGSAGSFDGGIRYVDIGDPAVFDFGNSDFSISTWSYRNSGFTSWDTTLLSKWNTGGSPGSNEWSLSNGSAISGLDTLPFFGIESGTTSYTAIGTESTNNNQWYHLVGIRNGNYIYLYVNGDLKASTFVGNIAINNIAGRTLKIAKIDGGSYGLNGRIDEVRIYNRALSSSEVKGLYNFAPGPLVQWKLNETSGTTTVDSGIGGISGTLVNGPTWTSGLYGNAINLDGSNDYVDFGNTLPNISGWKQMTITGWYYATSTGGVRTVISKFWEGDQGYGNSVYKIWLSGTNLYFKLSTVGSWDGQSVVVPGVTVNTWQHFAAVWDGSTYKIYLNGVKGEEKGRSGYLSNPNHKTTIGSVSDGTSSYFLGKIDDIRIYNYALTQPQIFKSMQEY